MRRRVYRNRAAFERALDLVIEKERIKVSKPVRKAILSALSERDESAEICRDGDGDPECDPELRDFENVPLTDDIHEYMKREVLPHVPEAWVDESRTKVGYEIPLTRHFYVYQPPRPLERIEAEITGLEQTIVRMLGEVAG